MSSTGATLSGSYSEASVEPTEAGFKWGTTPGNLNQTAPATASGTGGNLSATLTGLTPGTTYYYQAFVTVYGTGDYSSQSKTVYGSKCSFTTKAVSTAAVTTGSASGLAQTAATMNGSYAGASGNISEVGFFWSTSQATVNTPGSGTKVTASGTASPFSADLTLLTASTTYYYRAYAKEFNESTSSYDFKYGSVVSFTTPSAQSLPDYLSGYGMPDVSGIYNGLRTSGTYSDRDDKWYSYNTTNNKRQIAVHTYTTGSPTSSETLNYVILYDENNYAPVWTAHTMNTTYWPDNNAGRNDSWMDDPAINLTQQGGLDNASTVGYSRGHLVASDYRQTNVKQNKQTFYHSNQAPQWQNSFNSGVWSTMEQRVKTMAPSSSTTMLYVVTGVLYEGTVSNNQVTSATIPHKSSGSLSVAIPSHFYKCIMKCTLNGSGQVTAAQGIAFIFTNEAHSGNYYDSTFVTSIDAVEARAGFDFFSAVPDNIEASAESNTSHSWFTGQ